MPLGLIIAIIIAAGAGVSFSANNDLPGDTLYPVKIEINEELSDALALSARTQAQADASVAVRRVSEAEQLAARGELSAEVAANLETRFEERAQSFERHIESLRERGNLEAAAEASSDFEAALEAHERILSQMQAQNDILVSVLASVRERRDGVENMRTQAESRITSQLGVSVEAAARGRLRATDNKIAEVENYLNRTSERISAGALADARAQLEVAKELRAEGESELSTESFGEAFVLFQQAHRAAQQAQLMARTSTELNIQIGVGETNNESPEPDEEDPESDDGEENSENGENESEGTETEIRGQGNVQIDLEL